MSVSISASITGTLPTAIASKGSEALSFLRSVVAGDTSQTDASDTVASSTSAPPAKTSGSHSSTPARLTSQTSDLKTVVRSPTPVARLGQTTTPASAASVTPVNAPTTHSAAAAPVAAGAAIGVIAVCLLVAYFLLRRHRRRKIYLEGRSSNSSTFDRFLLLSNTTTSDKPSASSFNEKGFKDVPTAEKTSAPEWMPGSALIGSNKQGALGIDMAGKSQSSPIPLGMSPHLNLISREDAARKQRTERYSGVDEAPPQWLGYHRQSVHARQAPSLNPLEDVEGNRLSSGWYSNFSHADRSRGLDRLRTALPRQKSKEGEMVKTQSPDKTARPMLKGLFTRSKSKDLLSPSGPLNNPETKIAEPPMPKLSPTAEETDDRRAPDTKRPSRPRDLPDVGTYPTHNGLYSSPATPVAEMPSAFSPRLPHADNGSFGDRHRATSSVYTTHKQQSSHKQNSSYATASSQPHGPNTSEPQSSAPGSSGKFSDSEELSSNERFGTGSSHRSGSRLSSPFGAMPLYEEPEELDRPAVPSKNGPKKGESGLARLASGKSFRSRARGGELSR